MSAPLFISDFFPEPATTVLAQGPATIHCHFGFISPAASSCLLMKALSEAASDPAATAAAAAVAAPSSSTLSCSPTKTQAGLLRASTHSTPIPKAG